MSGKLAGRVAIVSGGASGIGAATAKLYAAEGARVALVDQDAALLAETKAAIESAGGTAMSLQADVSQVAPAHDGVARVLKEWGRLDVVCTAAGISTGGTVDTTDEAAWDRVFAVNVRGTYAWLHEALPAMIEAGGGTIVTVASQLAFSSGGRNAAYIATKGAIVSLTKTMAVDHAAQGIRVNAVAPGVIDTPMSRRSRLRYDDPAAAAVTLAARHPMNRFGRAEEVARAILFLSCEDSSFTTGTVLFVDGGWTAM